MKTLSLTALKGNLYLILLTLTITPRIFPFGTTVSDLFVFLVLLYLIVDSRMFFRHRMDRFQAAITVYSFSLLILQLSVALTASKSLIEPIKSFSALLYLFVGYTILKHHQTRLNQKASRLFLVLVFFELAISATQINTNQVTGLFRASGTFTNPNLLGSLIGTLGLFALYIQTTKRTLGVVLVVSSITILLSGSIGSIVAFSASIILFLFLQNPQKKEVKVSSHSIKSRILFPLSLIFLTTIFRGFEGIVYSISSRIVIWREALEGIRQNPLAPPENTIDWKITAPKLQTNWNGAITMDAHNDFLNFILEGGIIGGVLYLVFFAILLRFTNLKQLAGINFLFVSGLSSSVMTYSWLMLFIAYLVYESSLTKVKR